MTQYELVKTVSGLTSNEAISNLCNDVKWTSCYYKVPFNWNTVLMVYRCKQSYSVGWKAHIEKYLIIK